MCLKAEGYSSKASAILKFTTTTTPLCRVSCLLQQLLTLNTLRKTRLLSKRCMRLRVLGFEKNVSFQSNKRIPVAQNFIVAMGQDCLRRMLTKNELMNVFHVTRTEEERKMFRDSGERAIDIANPFLTCDHKYDIALRVVEQVAPDGKLSSDLSSCYFESFVKNLSDVALHRDAKFSSAVITLAYCLAADPRLLPFVPETLCYEALSRLNDGKDVSACVRIVYLMDLGESDCLDDRSRQHVLDTARDPNIDSIAFDLSVELLSSWAQNHAVIEPLAIAELLDKHSSEKR